MTFSVSPFSQRMTFVQGAPAVQAVAVSPSEATVSVGQRLQLTATVTTSNFANKAVIWESSDETKATVDATGAVTAIADGEVEITATSIFDSTKSDSATITVA